LQNTELQERVLYQGGTPERSTPRHAPHLQKARFGNGGEKALPRNSGKKKKGPPCRAGLEEKTLRLNPVSSFFLVG